ncbi:MAG TPA: carbamoyltransferase [Gammaproteobacteria bacterium]|nr:carbamoyltransferase [Gammaproteobacteria bacterium]
MKTHSPQKKPPVILGLNYAFHDASACIVKDGQLVCALEEERFTRSKHATGFPEQSVQHCLAIAGLEAGDITHIAVSAKPSLYWSRKLLYGLRHLSKAPSFIRHELIRLFWQQRALQGWYQLQWPESGHRPALHFIPHHACHAAGTFFVSPFESAAILSIDGSGEWSTSFLGQGSDDQVKSFGESYFPHSLGSFYEAATEYCGFQPNYDEGKTMGLAPFGDADRFYSQFRSMVKIDAEGGIHIDPSWFKYQYWGFQRCSARFEHEFGQPRRSSEPFEQHHYDVAAAAQRVLEETGVDIARQLYQKTREKNLVIAGGVSLNSVMNGCILRETPFDDVYMMAAAGDNGTSIGAAFYLQHAILGQPRTYVHLDPYVGTAYNNEEIKQVLDAAKLDYEFHQDIEAVAAKLLSQQRIIGWFQGRMEIGPRALGNRSILADPTNAAMKDKINAEVKHREAYRPFAPSVVVEARHEYFDIGVEDPFMLKVCHVLPEKKKILSAITHVDGTARLQTVSAQTNPRYHALIMEFGALSGVPVVLNTSFNVMGEPIVESPVDALRCFFTTGLDDLVIGNYRVSKS